MQRIALFTLLALVALPAAAQDAAAPAEAAPAEAAPAAPAPDAAKADEGKADEGKAEEAKPAEAPAEDAKPAEAPAGDEKKEVAPDAAATDAAAADAPASEAPATEAPAEAAPEPTTISVSSNPLGRVFLDGKDTGLDTPLVDHAIEPGTHTLKVVEAATGREKAVTFHLEAGNNLNLNLNLPELEKPATPVADAGDKKDGDKADAKTGDADTAGPGAAPAQDDWTWMTVAGWSGLGLGAMGLLAGTVVLTSQFSDGTDAPLGFGLFGAGAGLVLGGGVLIYLDSELGSDEGEAAGAAGEAESAWVPFRGLR